MKVFMVVGMHRSATSLVAKGLHDAGIDMGRNLLGGNAGNPNGHYEDSTAIEINDQILRAAGGAWNDPPPHDDIAAVGGASVAGYVAGRGRQDMWGIKDPRLALTWPVWLPHLPRPDLHVIWIRRDRGQVARSLHARDGIPLDRGVRLAEMYEQRIELLMRTLTA